MYPLILVIILVVGCTDSTQGTDRFTRFMNYFVDCKPDDVVWFDTCMKKALNHVRLAGFFQTGVPELNLPKMDKIFVHEILRTGEDKGATFRLKLFDLEEANWADAEITDFRFDSTLNLVEITQSFPEYSLTGKYDGLAKLQPQVVDLPKGFTKREEHREGVFSLKLYNCVRTISINKPTRSQVLAVTSEVKSISDIRVYTTNMFDDIAKEKLAHWYVHNLWRKYYDDVRPAFNFGYSYFALEVFNNHFLKFDYEKLFKKDTMLLP